MRMAKRILWIVLAWLALDYSFGSIVSNMMK